MKITYLTAEQVHYIDGKICKHCGVGYFTIKPHPDIGCSCFHRAPCSGCEASVLQCTYCKHTIYGKDTQGP